MHREELGKNINADEAAAMGAVYQAAALSKAFKVKPFLVRDAAIFPIQVGTSHSLSHMHIKKKIYIYIKNSLCFFVCVQKKWINVEQKSFSLLLKVPHAHG